MRSQWYVQFPAKLPSPRYKMRYIRPYQSIGRAGKGMASIDICYAVAAYKSVAESEILCIRYKHSFVPGADSGIADNMT